MRRPALLRAVPLLAVLLRPLGVAEVLVGDLGTDGQVGRDRDEAPLAPRREPTLGGSPVAGGVVGGPTLFPMRGGTGLGLAISRQLAASLEKIHLYEETRRAYENLRQTQEQLLQSRQETVAKVKEELDKIPVLRDRSDGIYKHLKSLGWTVKERQHPAVKEMRRGSELLVLDHQDLAAYRALWRDPIVIRDAPLQETGPAPTLTPRPPSPRRWRRSAPWPPSIPRWR